MNFYLAILAYLLIGLVIGGGILLLVGGKPWLLIIGLIAYVVTFAQTGCKSH
jgi:hypothetical protein